MTAHRCQGVTVDTTHTIATGRMTREAFYVAMTRGRASNHAYIDTDTCHGQLDTLGSERETRPVRTVLEQVLANQGAEQSAHAAQERLLTRRPIPYRSERSPGSQSHQRVGMTR